MLYPTDKKLLDQNGKFIANLVPNAEFPEAVLADLEHVYVNKPMLINEGDHPFNDIDRMFIDADGCIYVHANEKPQATGEGVYSYVLPFIKTQEPEYPIFLFAVSVQEVQEQPILTKEIDLKTGEQKDIEGEIPTPLYSVFDDSEFLDISNWTYDCEKEKVILLDENDVPFATPYKTDGLHAPVQTVVAVQGNGSIKSIMSESISSRSQVQVFKTGTGSYDIFMPLSFYPAATVQVSANSNGSVQAKIVGENLIQVKASNNIDSTDFTITVSTI
ncbi:MAG: hypothetical protein OXE99_03935 [Cellvibrionales bacterium]|nr:hypothetical protein [Cellvibrionales bacterium]